MSFQLKTHTFNNSNQNENFLYFYSIWYKTIVGHQLLKICIDIPIEFDI